MVRLRNKMKKFTFKNWPKMTKELDYEEDKNM